MAYPDHAGWLRPQSIILGSAPGGLTVGQNGAAPLGVL
jgi:hypothetical protein